MRSLRHPVYVTIVLATSGGLTLGVGCAFGNDKQQQHLDSAVPDAGIPSAICGNSQVEDGEECDDGNLLPGDGCSNNCTIEVCDAQTCFHGCCTVAGDCLDGVQDEACGRGGGSCGDCLAVSSLCFEQACLVVGDCTPGDDMTCGYCGARECDANGAWGACENEGECVPDEVSVTGSCGDCGYLERICQADCTWCAETCVGEGICSPGDVETGGSCGHCGTEERTCTSACTWDPYVCTAEGICPTDEQCCNDVCTPYVCVSGGLPRMAETQDAWPADPACTDGRFLVGVVTERHWGFHRKYSICVDDAPDGTITRCTGEVGVCSPPDCPTGMADLGVYVDKGSASDTEQQRICVGGATVGRITECAGPVGSNTCVPTACASGEVSIGEIKEIEEGVESRNMRLCVTPQCPPSCT